MVAVRPAHPAPHLGFESPDSKDAVVHPDPASAAAADMADAAVQEEVQEVEEVIDVPDAAAPAQSVASFSLVQAAVPPLGVAKPEERPVPLASAVE